MTPSQQSYTGLCTQSIIRSCTCRNMVPGHETVVEGVSHHQDMFTSSSFATDLMQGTVENMSDFRLILHESAAQSPSSATLRPSETGVLVCSRATV